VAQIAELRAQLAAAGERIQHLQGASKGGGSHGGGREKDRQIAELRQRLQEQDREMQAKDRELKEERRKGDAKDREIAQLRAQLARRR
jgi:predicted RNase H-like nuclease (RuvC/YqgF family)